MKLWTIQTIGFYEKLLEDKIIYGSKQYITFTEFLSGYHWLMNKMDSKIGKRPFPDCYPLWAWYQWKSAKKDKPDLRSSAHFPKGTKAVRIEIEKDDNKVLLSDFMLWHFPMSYHGYIGSCEKDSVAFEKMLEEKGLDRRKLNALPNNIRKEIIKSWDSVIDMEYEDTYFTYPKEHKSIQATFWSLSINEIIKVDEFIAR